MKKAISVILTVVMLFGSSTLADAKSDKPQRHQDKIITVGKKDKPGSTPASTPAAKPLPSSTSKPAPKETPQVKETNKEMTRRMLLSKKPSQISSRSVTPWSNS
jgi:hypothetical protein